MTYELAKQLKDEGFPLKEVPKGIKTEREAFIFNSSEIFYVPTLSELIEACGEDFRSLRKEGGIWWAITIYAEMPLYKGDKPCTAIKGYSPEEAVAKLWIELNRK